MDAEWPQTFSLVKKFFKAAAPADEETQQVGTRAPPLVIVSPVVVGFCDVPGTEWMLRSFL